MLRADSRGRKVPARVLLFPRYEPGAAAELVPMRRVEAFVEVTNNSFNFVDHGGQWMEPVRRLVMQCWCGRLTIGEPERVHALIQHLFGAQGGTQG
jgi:hypothetical protein